MNMKKGLSNEVNLLLITGGLIVLVTIANFFSIQIGTFTLSEFFSDLTGIETAHLVFPDAIWLVILPFLATGTILMWLLDKTMRVSGNTGLIIAICWAAVLFNPYVPVYLILAGLYGFAGFIGPLLFTVVAIFGFWNWYKKSRYYQTSSVAEFEADIRQKNDEIIALEKKLKNERDETKSAQIMENLNTTRKQLAKLKSQAEKFEKDI